MEKGSGFVVLFLAARPGTGHCPPLMLTALILAHPSSYPTKWDLALSSTAPNFTELSINHLESQTNHFAEKKSAAHLCFPGPFCLLKNVPVDFIVLVLQLVQLHLPQLPAHRTERVPLGLGTGMPQRDGSQELWTEPWKISKLQTVTPSPAPWAA